MAKPIRFQGGARPQGSQQPTSRPSLVPEKPLSGRVAVVQAILLLGIPITLLFVAKIVLRKFFPQLGY